MQSIQSLSKQAIFLDKDGTLIQDVPYNIDPTKIEFTSGAIAALQQLHQAGYLLIVISNQSGVARGYFLESDLEPVEHYLRSQLAKFNIPLAGFYYCPHHPAGNVLEYAIACQCRKPQPGMIVQAAQEHAIDLKRSWFVGDILHDVQAGRSAGCRAVLIDNGNETEWELSPLRLPHHVVKNLVEAAQVIVALDRGTHEPLVENQTDCDRATFSREISSTQTTIELEAPL